MTPPAVTPGPTQLLAQATGALSAHQVRDIVEKLWGIVAASPWLGVVLVIVVVGSCARVTRAVIHGGHRPDPDRRFSRADKAVILAPAGHRCEARHPLYGRCDHTENLQADHVHPHSRGGWTAVENGQALCARHNMSKSARVPWNWLLDRLARRRATYLPDGTSTEVIRHRPRSSSFSSSSAPSSGARPARGTVVSREAVEYR